MDNLEQRVALAKADPSRIDDLVADYLPFIKKQLAASPVFGLEYDDSLSLAMLAFVNCIRQYDTKKGGFLGFAAVCIRNRLIDECRRVRRQSGRIIPLEDGESPGAEGQASLAFYSREQERRSLAEEIAQLSEALAPYGVAFGELPAICPRQDRSRRQCIGLARALVGDPAMRRSLLAARRIPQGELAERFGVSVKTVEKHRKYIVTLCVLLLGDYPGIRAFIPQYGEVTE